MRRFAILRLLPVLAIVACGPEAGTGSGVAVEPGNLPGAGGGANDPQGSLGGVELCDAPSYRPLVGQPVSAATFPAGPKLRVYSDSDVVTQEYMPNRTNVVYDDTTGLILRVFCG